MMATLSTEFSVSAASDYGSDFSEGEEVLVNELLRNIDQVSPADLNNHRGEQTQYPASYEVSGAPPEAVVLSAQANTPAGIREPKYRQTLNETDLPLPVTQETVQYPDLSDALPKSEAEDASAIAPDDGNPRVSRLVDTRSPLERFRSFPRKPLTASDISSGAWCELQYWYILTRLPGGRKTKTVAMSGGSRVHQTLEDQVHTTVRVSISAKEEAFALRLWNVVQGLRTLRDTGMTRELEVWGNIEGETVNGIIDELSYTSPDVGFEDELHSQSSQQDSSQTKSEPTSIAGFFKPHQRKIYLTDVKTRGSTRLPTGAALRPARVQLFVYHRLLRDMAAGCLDIHSICARYGLSPEARFSDPFMAQMGGLHDEIFYDAESDVESTADVPGVTESARQGSYPDPSPDFIPDSCPAPDFLRYRNITQMIPLFNSELQTTFPQGADSLGDLLAVQYRHREDGRILGVNSFPNDPTALTAYMKRNLSWWRGFREAEGVTLEESYKCRSCEFAESCEWRKDKETEILRRVRNNGKKSRRQSAAK